MYEFKIITSAVIVNDKREFLLGKRSMDEDVFPGLWSIPGGKVEHGPAQREVLESNVKKEVLEEFGVEIEISSYIQSHSNGEGKIYIIFLGKLLNGTPKPLEDTDEVSWVKFENVKADTLCPEVYDILKKVNIMRDLK